MGYSLDDFRMAPIPADVDADMMEHLQPADPDDREPRRVAKASTLFGYKVKNGAGEHLGQIEEIMIDLPTGRVAYAVLSFGGFLGIGSKLFAVPWAALRMDPRNGDFIIDVARERLEQAPGFDRDHWPDMADPAFETQIYGYYDHLR